MSRPFCPGFAAEEKQSRWDSAFPLWILARGYNCFVWSTITIITMSGPRRAADIGPGVRMAPNVSLRNGERIKIGAYSHIGSRCSLWAGDSVGRITLGRHALLGPEVFITASNYQIEPGTPVMDQPKRERDVVIGDDVWLGARVMVVAGRRDRGRLHRRRKLRGHAVDSGRFDRGRKPGANHRPEG